MYWAKWAASCSALRCVSKWRHILALMSHMQLSGTRRCPACDKRKGCHHPLSMLGRGPSEPHYLTKFIQHHCKNLSPYVWARVQDHLNNGK